MSSGVGVQEPTKGTEDLGARRTQTSSCQESRMVVVMMLVVKVKLEIARRFR